MSRPRLAAFALSLLVLVVLSVGQAIGYERSSQEPPPPKDVATALAQLQERIDVLERARKEDRKAHTKQQDKIKELEQSITTLTQRVEKLDRNTIGQINREIDQVERGLADLDKRVRRLE